MCAPEVPVPANRQAAPKVQYTVQAPSPGGTQNSVAIFGGRNPSIGNNVTCTEEWNGVTWAQRGTLNNGRRRLAGAGTRAEALAISGDAPGHASTEEYAGSGIYKNLVICALTGSQA